MGAQEVESHRVSAVVLAWNRKRHVEIVLDRLAELPLFEVIVVDNGNDGTAEMAEERGNVRVLRMGKNVGIAGRNRGAEKASGDLLLMLDDDAYPLPGSVEKMVEVFRAFPQIGLIGGLVRELDKEGRVFREHEVGTFDWFLRGGHKGPTPPGGFPAFFFPEGACMARREAFLEVGGYLEAFFSDTTELELTARLLAAGWDVRYLPEAPFNHMKGETSFTVPVQLEMRARNQLWYFWMYFPPLMAFRRMVLYSFFELIQSVGRRAYASWFKAIAEAWTKRDMVREHRRRLPREVLRRAELNRESLHWRLLGSYVRRLFFTRS